MNEKDRIEHAGGFVNENRVNGNLNLSRCFGDFVFKLDSTLSRDKQLVIVKPDVRKIELNSCKFVILACDGI